MKILTYIHVLGVVFLSLSMAYAQEGSPAMEISLSETLELANQGNWDLLRAKEFIEQSQGAVAESRAVFLPNVRLSETFTTTTDPLMVFGFKLKQEITELSDFDPETLNNPERIENFNTRIEVMQPLLNMDGIWKRKAAESMTENSEESYAWEKNQIALQAKALYFQLLLSYRQDEVVNKSYEAAIMNAQNAENLYEQGLLSKSDLLAAKMRTTEYESALIEIDNQLFKVNSDLVHFLQLPAETTLLPIDEMDDEILNMPIPENMSVSENRADLKALKSRIKASEYEIKAHQHSGLPRLNLMGSYEWNDQVIFGGSASNYLVGANLQWDIFQGGKRAGQIQKSKSTNRIADLNYREKLSNSQAEVKQLQNKIRLSYKQLELADLSEKQAEESFEIVSDRFKEGLEKTSDLLLSESNLLKKRLTKLQMQNQHQLLIFKLEVLTGLEIISTSL